MSGCFFYYGLLSFEKDGTSRSQGQLNLAKLRIDIRADGGQFSRQNDVALYPPHIAAHKICTNAGVNSPTVDFEEKTSVVNGRLTFDRIVLSISLTTGDDVCES